MSLQTSAGSSMSLKVPPSLLDEEENRRSCAVMDGTAKATRRVVCQDQTNFSLIWTSRFYEWDHHFTLTSYSSRQYLTSRYQKYLHPQKAHISSTRSPQPFSPNSTQTQSCSFSKMSGSIRCILSWLCGAQSNCVTLMVIFIQRTCRSNDMSSQTFLIYRGILLPSGLPHVHDPRIKINCPLPHTS